MVVLGNAVSSHPHIQPFCLSWGCSSKNYCALSIHCLTGLHMALCYDSPFTIEEAEAQIGDVTYPR